MTDLAKDIEFRKQAIRSFEGMNTFAKAMKKLAADEMRKYDELGNHEASYVASGRYLAYEDVEKYTETVIKINQNVLNAYETEAEIEKIQKE